MGAFIDRTGFRYGRLTVRKRIPKEKYDKNVYWVCKCDCGNIIQVTSRSLLSGNTKSCGCIQKEQLRERNIKNAIHGGSDRERLYGVWHAMRQRCNDKGRKDYLNYGGRGISVCSEWDDYSCFRKWSLKHGYDPEAIFMGCTLDRIDVNGNYEPSNCRWVDMKFQANNRRERKRI